MSIDENTALQLLAWLSVDIEELHHVQVPALVESWDRFKARGDLYDDPPRVQNAPADETQTQAGDRNG
jgi:hypothetical protein